MKTKKCRYCGSKFGMQSVRTNFPPWGLFCGNFCITQFEKDIEKEKSVAKVELEDYMTSSHD